MGGATRPLYPERRRNICPRAAIPRGTFDLRFRGNSSGRGANLTLRAGNDEQDAFALIVVGRVVSSDSVVSIVVVLGVWTEKSSQDGRVWMDQDDFTVGGVANEDTWLFEGISSVKVRLGSSSAIDVV